VRVVKAIYDRIGVGYALGRAPEPRWQAVIQRALGAAKTVVNVGAGAGSYEPGDRYVLAVEPSDVMIGQRPASAAPAIKATAEQMPIADQQFDVAMAISTLHHWNDWRAGLDEMLRVASRMVVLHFDPAVHDDFWLVRDYLPELSEVWANTPTVTQVAAQMGGEATVQTMPVPWDCRDGFLSAYWRRPDAYLDPDVRQCMSGLLAIDPKSLAHAVTMLSSDLKSGKWRNRNAELLDSEEYDGGWRLICK
jgi:SAM-dependent methyltransferase